MDYSKTYRDIISLAILQNRKRHKVSSAGYVYYEKHHIVPKCMGGSDEPENLVFLTAKEHFVAHHLLSKMHNTRELIYAFWAMCNQSSGLQDRNYNVNSTAYKTSRENFALVHSQNLKNSNKGEDNKFFGLHHTDDVKEYLSKLNKGVDRSSEEEKEKRRQRMIGDKNPNYGGNFSKEHINRISTSKQGKPSPKKGIPVINAKSLVSVKTPLGNFISFAEAAREHNIHKVYIRYRCYSVLPQWAEWSITG